MRTYIEVTPGSPAEEFVEYLHEVHEKNRTMVARTLHDDIGSLLVAASMDLAWTEGRLSDPSTQQRMSRLRSSLATAIDIKRRVVEDLRPTFLDNFGLLAALRWYFKHDCQQSSAMCADSYPEHEVALPNSVLSNTFRATQSVLDCIFSESHLATVSMDVTAQADLLTIKVSHAHSQRETVDVLSQYPNQLLSAAHRLATAGGTLCFEPEPDGGVFQIDVPITS